MRVAFKAGVIDLGFWRTAQRGALDVRGTPSIRQLRGKHGGERACHRVFLAYDCRRKQNKQCREAPMTSRIETYRVSAYNTAKQSENKMHDDTVAKRFGFSGGLVPGVDVMAYMMHM